MFLLLAMCVAFRHSVYTYSETKNMGETCVFFLLVMCTVCVGNNKENKGRLVCF